MTTKAKTIVTISAVLLVVSSVGFYVYIYYKNKRQTEILRQSVENMTQKYNVF